MTKFWLGRDGYNSYSYTLFETRPKRRVFGKDKDNPGTLSFSSEDRSCVFNDEEVHWIFESRNMDVVDMEPGDVLEIEIKVGELPE